MATDENMYLPLDDDVREIHRLHACGGYSGTFAGVTDSLTSAVCKNQLDTLNMNGGILTTCSS